MTGRYYIYSEQFLLYFEMDLPTCYIVMLLAALLQTGKTPSNIHVYLAF